jgi:hypothetical protein
VGVCAGPDGWNDATGVVGRLVVTSCRDPTLARSEPDPALVHHAGSGHADTAGTFGRDHWLTGASRPREITLLGEGEL